MSSASAADSLISWRILTCRKNSAFAPRAICALFEPAILALAETATPFEINTAGLRKECRELYPAREFLEMAHAAAVPLLINSDAHAPAELASGFPEAAVAAHTAGYRETLRFHSRRRSTVPLE